MTDEQQQEQAPEVDLSAEFAAGFSNEAPREEPKQEAIEEPTPEEKQEEPAPVEEPEEPPKPETVSITAEQWQAMQQKLSEVDTLKHELSRRTDQAFGRIGEIQRTLQQQPKGLQLSKDKFKRLGNDFPELATLLAEDLSEALGTAPAQQEQKAETQGVNAEEIRRAIEAQMEQRLQKERFELEAKLLSRRHKDWQEVVSSEDFIKWGGTLPMQEWHDLRNSSDSDTVADAIDRFRAHQSKAQADAKAAAEKAAKRQSASKRLEAAITPTGTAGSVPQVTERDLFLQGFSSP